MPAGQELTQPMFIQSTSQTADGQVSTQVSADWCASPLPGCPGTKCAVTTPLQTSLTRGIPYHTHHQFPQFRLSHRATWLTALTALSFTASVQLLLFSDCSYTDDETVAEICFVCVTAWAILGHSHSAPTTMFGSTGVYPVMSLTNCPSLVKHHIILNAFFLFTKQQKLWCFSRPVGGNIVFRALLMQLYDLARTI